ncbi:MAG: amidophosphoribosyltransferase [Planctomycetes bacterium]|nr:amidophosphoribosyltransferase [Planctomycetota bacterium]
MCGFISIMGPEGSDVIQEVLTGLLAIQHRGQDAAGVVTCGDRFQAKKGLGLVRDVFEPRHLERLRGPMAVGHVRYPTVGGNEDADVQPFWVDFPVGIAMAHNGNVTNFHELRRDYFPRQTPQGRLASNCDLEAVLYVFAGQLFQRKAERIKPEDVRDAVAEVFRTVKGAYSVVGLIAGAGMYAFRDPYGIKPIILGKRETDRGTFYAVASESVVLDVAGYEAVRDLNAGELLWIDTDRRLHSFQVSVRPHRPCIFEYIYFARPDSVLDGALVYQTRIRLGAELAKSWRRTGLEADVVIPVPESARTAAQEMAEVLGIPYREGFVKNRYVGRTFIMPNDTERRSSIRHKLNPIRMEFEGKRVLILDDSIVRGNTSRQIVRIARQMGAAKVYMASYSPALTHPCPYGIDMSTKNEFIARGRTVDEVCKELGADHLIYQGIDAMVRAVREVTGDHREFCMACFDGDYPTGDVTERVLADIEADRLAASGGGKA